MRIPVFVSCPTQLNPQQQQIRNVIMKLLDELQLEPRALGRTDYPKDYPLKEVYVVARHCSGGLILGFEQFFTKSGIWKRGTKEEGYVSSKRPAAFPTPWNQLESGILFGLKLPLLVFRDLFVSGGVFDVGTTEVFIHSMPSPKLTAKKYDELKQVFLKWHAEVSRHYYSY
jgi:hypothetical protein